MAGPPLEKIDAYIRELFGIKLHLSPLYSYDDLNLKGVDPEGEEFIIKLMHLGFDHNFLGDLATLLEHLESKDLKLETPRVIQSLKNNPYEFVSYDGEQRILFVLTFVDGELYSKFKPHTNELVKSFGRALATLNNAMEDFTPKLPLKNHLWCLSNSTEVIPYLDYVKEPIKHDLKTIFSNFSEHIKNELKGLRHAVIHNDANDFNILVKTLPDGEAWMSGIFDFGDISNQPVICEIAIALAYAVMGHEEPIGVMQNFLREYHLVRKIQKRELEFLFDLIKTRLAVSITMSFFKEATEPGNLYAVESQAIAIDTLNILNELNDDLVNCALLISCGYPVVEHQKNVLNYLHNPELQISEIVQGLNSETAIDLSVGSSMLGSNPHYFDSENLDVAIKKEMSRNNDDYALGRYSEYRRVYQDPNFGYGGYELDKKRTLHLGVDIFCNDLQEIRAPLRGIVVDSKVMDGHLDYGGVIMLEHKTDKQISFYTLYGHLSHESVEKIKKGTKIEAGSILAKLGTAEENGHWPPHLHFQLIINHLGLALDFPGVVKHSESNIWKALSPDPSVLMSFIKEKALLSPHSIKDLQTRRKDTISSTVTLSYRQPINMVAGFMQYLYDSEGQAYLDFYNNIHHVGHQNPRVVKAIQEQTQLFNGNTRYLNPIVVEYAELLLAAFPKSLNRCFFLNSATEANELAIRLARNYTNQNDIIVLEGAYHGHSSNLINLSPYKYGGPGGEGKKSWVHEAPIPDGYRGKYKYDNPEAGKLYALEIEKIVYDLNSKKSLPAAFIAESIPSVAGQILFPPGYLSHLYQYLRSNSIVCIADEVQTGFGRLGEVFWGFELQNVVPDIVVLGKPIGNGYPLAAVVCKAEIADAFDNGMEFFSSFGGNPVACAAGLAVMKEIVSLDLQSKAKSMGDKLMTFLQELKADHSIIGDVRGRGLFLGIELVENHETMEPAPAKTKYLVERLKEFKILTGVDGPLKNVLKLRPSMLMDEDDLAYFKSCISCILKENYLNK